ncbi:S8 family serine peptidase [Catellatospora tritici]|uniref:S8 family serine peptidase n=1 Tax=Catellatospora tritici TaxID=2851566 RepID=UPI001C2D979B|nr:S8 family serine peptidase [Catellatospora tritici]MBV1855276.1 S8 family serine peptidase [Catellatospora tritici]
MGVLVVPLAGATWTTPSAAAPSPSRFTATKIEASSYVKGEKTPSSRLAQTDPSLLGRKDSALVPVLVKLDVDALATYTGGVQGYAATSPTVTGRQLSGSAAEKRYEGYLVQREDAFVKALAKVPGAKAGTRLRTVYGGVAAVVPANRIADLLKIPGVAAVQKDELRKPLTDASSAFIGATSLYPGLGGTRNAGKGVIIGVIDTGAWPEHPSFADQGNLGTPPAKADGTARECDFGDNPLTPASDVFACNHKLIGGGRFLDTYDVLTHDDMYPGARDSGGHGTHTASTAAGDKLASATVFGVERGPLNGVAPGAWLSVYKALGPQGGYSSDLAAAAQQAILDGVSVINYSISGGSNPYTDPVELTFLDAYAAGVFVAASAGNSGPGEATTDHVAPWVTTVAASTQTREFVSTLTLKGGADTLTLTGASITSGVGESPVVLASEAPYSDALCTTTPPAGLFTGKILACQRGVNARVEKGLHASEGGAAGMILFNASLADVETDNHFLPAVHLADGADFLAFLGGHTGVTASFTGGAKHNGQGDVMAAFSSRGPGGLGIKPDITAPGVQILAGNTPTPDSPEGGPAGQYFQAIAGTSMSSPHIAGAAVLLKAAHPTWTPGQIKSAMMTTAKTSVVKEDTVTPADPFDYGSGRLDLTKASNPGLTFDETPERMNTLGRDELTAVDLNLPSINVPTLPGRIVTQRVAKNVSGKSLTYKVSTTSPTKSKITVSPSTFTLAPGKSVKLTVTISSWAETGQYFGQIKLTPTKAGQPVLHLPVAFVPQQGSVSLNSTCADTSIVKYGTTSCTVTAVNNSFGDATVDFKTTVDSDLKVTGATGATVKNGSTVELNDVTLPGAASGVPSIDPGVTPAGYLPLSLFGIAPTPVGDEDMVNFNVPEFLFNGVSYNRVGVDSNGYLVVGGGTSEDNNCCNLMEIPNAARPNNVLAPFWTDLDGGMDEGIRVASLTDGVSSWLVFEWQVDVFGTNSNRHFQVWIGINGTQDISFTYDPDALPANPGQPFLVGAENDSGLGGEGLPLGTLPTEDLVVTSTDPTPGGTATYTVNLRGISTGVGLVTTEMVASTVPGTTVVNSAILVTHSGSHTGHQP